MFLNCSGKKISQMCGNPGNNLMILSSVNFFSLNQGLFVAVHPSQEARGEHVRVLLRPPLRGRAGHHHQALQRAAPDSA